MLFCYRNSIYKAFIMFRIFFGSWGDSLLFFWWVGEVGLDLMVKGRGIGNCRFLFEVVEGEEVNGLV